MEQDTKISVKPISTLDLSLQLLGLAKSFGLALLVLIIDYLRRRRAQAEKTVAMLETKASIEAQKQEIDLEASTKDASSVVDDFLKSDSDSG